MVYSSGLSNPSVVALARAGNAQAIAHWLNQVLLPQGIRAYVGTGGRVGCLRVLLELPPPPRSRKLPDRWQSALMRYTCHRLWELNSARIEGVRVALRFGKQPRIVWEQSIRVVSPALRQRKQALQLQSQVHQVGHRRRRAKRLRSLLLGGPAVAAFLVGSIMGYAKAPVEQTNASASSSPPKPPSSSRTNRPDTVQAALESVPVVKHTQVANPDDPTVTLMFSGDVTLADNFETVMGNDHPRAFAQIEEYRRADVAMVNLENPLTRSTLAMPGKQFNFKAKPEAVEVLKSGGVDIVTLANNHSMDYRAEGLVETMQTLDSAGIHHLGAGRDGVEARRPDILDVKGQRIAYLGYWGEEYGAGANQAGVNSILEDRIAQDIRAIRSQVDWIVVNYHWGQELAQMPADWQIQLAHFTIDQGADLVVGHHPHVLQGAEVYKGRAIAYSLGNFIFGGNSRTDYDTAVLRVALKDQQMKVEFLPVVVQGYQPQVVSGDRGTAILKELETLSASFPQPMQPSMVLEAARPQPTSTPSPTLPFAQPLIPVPQATPGAILPGSGDAHAPMPSTDPLLPPVTAPSASPDAALPGMEPSAAPEPSAPPLPDPMQSPGSPQLPAPENDPAAVPSPPEIDPPPAEAGTPAPLAPSPAPTLFNHQIDSFINSPNHTPLNPATPQLPLIPTHSNSAQPTVGVPEAMEASPMVDPSPQGNPPGDPTQDLENSVTALPPILQSRRNPARKTGATPALRQENRKIPWNQAGQVGEDLIPEVSLMAVNPW